MDKDLFEQGAEAVGKGITTAKNLFRQFLNWILFATLIIVTTLLTFIALGLTSRLTETVIVNALFMFITGTAALLVFFPQGEQNEIAKNTQYNDNLKEWGSRSDEVRKQGKLAEFREHCKDKTKELRDDIKFMYILNAGIDITDYEKEYKDLTIKQIRKHSKLNKEQKNWLVKSKKNIKILPINPIAVLAGAELKPGRSIGQKRFSTKQTLLFWRVLGTVFMTAALGTITFAPVEAVGWSAIGLFALRILTIITSSVMGFYSGISKVKADNNDNKAKILFINEFLEKQNKKIAPLN